MTKNILLAEETTGIINNARNRDKNNYGISFGRIITGITQSLTGTRGRNVQRKSNTTSSIRSSAERSSRSRNQFYYYL